MITNTKKTKKTYYKFFAYMELYGAPRARTIKEEKDLFTSALREIESERERVHNYLELPNNSHSFFYLFLLKNLLRHRKSVPLSCGGHIQ